jgi:NADPH:quinone reductase-like Zn-dependent oxidoreductase
LFDAGKLRSLEDSLYPLSEVAAAHAHSESGRARGKIILQVIAD